MCVTGHFIETRITSSAFPFKEGVSGLETLEFVRGIYTRLFKYFSGQLDYIM